jgi:dienelactone hydrolase
MFVRQIASRPMIRALLALTAVAPLLVAASPAAQHYHWYPAADDAKPRPWAILFPRAMGIGMLAPGNQYVEMAKFLNARGIDAMVIDDDRALAILKPKGGAGPARAAIAADVLAHAREQGRMDMRCPGVAIGWSRGGEGPLTLASSAEGGRTGVKAAIVYYPSVRGQQKPWPQLHPVLALQGTGDSLAPHKTLEALAASRSPQMAFTIKLYPNAKHRFDVARPTGKPDAAQVERDFDAAAHKDALAAIDAFLKDQGISGQSCALD